MDMPSLFPSETNANANSNNSESDPSIHVSFKAGLLTMNETSKQVNPDPRPGTFQICTSTEDGLVHIQWKPRATSTTDTTTDVNVEKDLILINGEIEMKKVESCPPASRVYVLKWLGSGTNTRLFLWMQEKDATQDSIRVSLVNSILEYGPTPQQFLQNDQEDVSTPLLQQEQESPSISSLPHQQQQEQVERTSRSLPTTTTDTQVQEPSAPTLTPIPVSSSTPTPATPAPSNANTNPATATGANTSSGGAASASGAGITLDQIRAALGVTRNSQEDNLQRQQEILATTPTPKDLLQIEFLQNALEDSKVKDKFESLLQFLPPDDRSLQGLLAVLRSHELESQVSGLSQALNSTQAHELLRSFDLLDDNSDIFGSKAFIDALLKIQKENSNNNNSENEKDVDMKD